MSRMYLFFAFVMLAIGSLVFGPEWASRTLKGMEK